MQPTYRRLDSPTQAASTRSSLKFPVFYRGQRLEAEAKAESDPKTDSSREMSHHDTDDQHRSSPMSQLVHAFCQGNWGIIDRWLARQFYRLTRWFKQQRF